MKKSLFQLTLSFAVIAILTVFAVSPIRFVKMKAGSWMANLPDDRQIRSLSIPGTHDSGAMYSIADVYGKCQTLSVSGQLASGVRFLDLRLRLVDDGLYVYHSFVEQKTEFQRLLYDLAMFLRENPSEFLIVSLKEEEAPIRSEKAFSKALEEMLGEYPDVVNAARTLPETVKEARGKMHILARYEDATLGVPCGRGWKNNTAFVLNDIFVQDHYELSGMDEKLSDIRLAMEAAADEKHALTLNFLSAYFASDFPPAYAGKPAQTIRAFILERIGETEGALGVMVCDFMTSDLAHAIIGRNFG